MGDAPRESVNSLSALVRELQSELSTARRDLADARAQIPDDAAINQLIADYNRAHPPAAVAAATTTSFFVNPYEDDINPTTKHGVALFQSATKARESSELIKPNVQNGKKFLQMMRTDSSQFAWGSLISKIKTDDSGTTKDMLKDWQEIKLDDVLRQSRPIFQNRNANWTDALNDSRSTFAIDPATRVTDKKVYFQRVRSNMIGRRILNSLTNRGLETLQINKKHYTWIDAASGNEYLDGPYILLALLQHCNPSTRVGVSDLKENLRNSNLAKFNNNVVDMLDKMSENYNQILDRNSTHDDIVLDIFRALSSTKNKEFLDFVNSKKTAWETGEDFSHEELISLAVAKYNNLCTQKTWKDNSAKDDTIVALTTQVTELQKKLESVSKSKSGDGSNNQSSEIASWRYKKSLGESVTKDDKTWYWCTKHNKGKGLYVTHKPEDHDKRGSTTKDSSSSGNKGSQKLVPNDKLKAAMVSKFKCTAEEAEELLNGEGN